MPYGKRGQKHMKSVDIFSAIIWVKLKHKMVANERRTAC